MEHIFKYFELLKMLVYSRNVLISLRLEIGVKLSSCLLNRTDQWHGQYPKKYGRGCHFTTCLLQQEDNVVVALERS